MTRYHRFEVEPLPDRRWAEIDRHVLGTVAAEQAVAARTPERSRRGTIAAFSLASAATLTSAVAALWALSAVEPPRAAMSRLTTDRSETVASVGDVRMEVAALSSVLWFERSTDEYAVSIEHGSARFLVPPREGRPAFVVQAGDVSVEVIGTRFTVTRPAGSSTGSVEVEEGTVRVTIGDEEHVLHAGGRWPDAGGETSVATPPDTLALGPEPSSVGSPLAVSGEDRPVAPDDGRPSIVEASGSPSLDSAGRSGGTASARAARTEARGGAPELAEETAAPGGAVVGREAFALAESLETREPERALELYAEVARGPTPWAANALFAQARLEIERGRREQGRAHLGRYLLRYPEGANVEDARALLERTR